MGFFSFSSHDLLFGSKYDATTVDDLPKLPHQQFWGLLGNPNIAEVQAKCKELEWQYQQLQKNKQKIKLSFLFRSLLIIPGIMLYLFFPHNLILVLIILSIFHLFYAVIVMRKLRIDMIKYLLAKKKGWLYDPQENNLLARSLSASYAEIFPLGNSCKLDDQLWGFTKSNTPFYAGEYTYETGSGKNRQVHNHHFFSFQLKKKLPVNFKLAPESHRFFGLLGKGKEIEVESIAFNKTFAFFYEGTKELSGKDIVKILSPHVQTLLVDLEKKKRRLSVLFKGDVIIFFFSHTLLRFPKTTLLGDETISPKDIVVVDEYIDLCSEIAYELSSKLAK